MVKEFLEQTFYCQRFQCRILPRRCIERQGSGDMEIHEACSNCSQGREIARKAGIKISSLQVKSSWRHSFGRLSLRKKPLVKAKRPVGGKSQRRGSASKAA